MGQEVPENTVLEDYASRFGGVQPCAIDSATAQKLTQRLGAKDFQGHGRELVIDSTKDALASMMPDPSKIRLPTGCYYIFALCGSAEERQNFDSAT